MDGWEINEESSYSTAVIGCGGFEAIDVVLESIDYALHRNPQGFPQVPGYPDIHLAKTCLAVHDGKIIPALRIWFRVDSKTRTVTKLYIEMSSPEEMRYLSDDDQFPF